MENPLELFSKQQAIVACFVQHLAYARGIRAAMESFIEHSRFWESTASTHLGQATVDWCKVFGTDCEPTHWKKLVADDAGKQAIEEFRSGIRAKTGLTQPEWQAYHQKMVSLRGKFVAHFELNKPFSEPTPVFDTALHVTYAYQEWVKPLFRKALSEQSHPEIWAEPPYIFISQYETWKAEAFSIASPK